MSTERDLVNMQSVLAALLVLFGICTPIMTEPSYSETECYPTELVMTNNTLKTFTIEPFYYKSIRLNISNRILEEYALFEILVDCMNTECDQYIEKIPNDIKETNQTIISIPPLSQANPIWKNFVLGENYSVVFHFLHEKNGNCLEYARNITIPECLPDKDKMKCSCRMEKYSPNVDIITIERESNDTWVVYWDTDHDSSPSNFISEVYFEYIKNNTEYLDFEDILWEPNKSYARVVFSDPVETTNDYTIIGEFYNGYGCLSYVEYKFIPEDLVSDLPSYKLIISTVMIVISVVLAIILKMVIPCILPWCSKSHKNSNLSNVIITKECLLSAQKKLVVNPTYIKEPINPFQEFEISRESITLTKQLGKGYFGTVYEADAFNIDNTKGFTKVAVKTHRENPTTEELQDFKTEIDMMIKVGEHENIVRFLGCCTIGQPYYMIMEFIPQQLKQYLIGLRDKWRDLRTSSFKMYTVSTLGGYRKLIEVPDSPISSTSSSGRFPSTSTDETDLSSEPSSPLLLEEQVMETMELQCFAFQIAKGMAYLEKIGITHRDLAARNILLDENKTLKISDFGMSKTGSYINFYPTKVLPLRWMAIESIVDRIYNNKTDVWSFGVILWEIGTLGAFPYNDVDDKVLLSYLKRGGRLDRPDICTEELYSIMLRCWSENPSERPNFQELVDLVDVKKKKAYADLSLINSDYVFLPTSYNETLT